MLWNLLADVCFLCVVAAATCFVVERRWRWRWREVEAGLVPVLATADASGGAYRDGGTVPRYYAAAPRAVRFTAFTCIAFGQLFVPAFFFMLISLPLYGLGLLAIPSVLAAGKLYRAGFALLRREPRVAWFRALEAAAWALWVYAIVLGAAFALAAVLTLWCHLPACALAVPGLVAAFAAASIVQALLLRRTARRYEDALFAPSAHPFAA